MLPRGGKDKVYIRINLKPDYDVSPGVKDITATRVSRQTVLKLVLTHFKVRFILLILMCLAPESKQVIEQK